MNTAIENQIVNGIDTDALRAVIETVKQDPAHAATHWQVATHWRGGTRSDTKVTECTLGGNKVAKDFTIRIDEPLQFGGTNQYANPQEYLLASLNACMIVGYSALCALEGIELSELRIETEGDIDLRGFLGLSTDGEARLRRAALHRAHQGQRHARAVREDPPRRHGDLAQLLQCPQLRHAPV